MKSILLTLLITLMGFHLEAQEKITGTWKTEKDNTLVKIEKQNDAYIGKVISSDNENIEPGSLIVRSIKPQKGNMKGQIFIHRWDKWYDGTFQVLDNKMKVSVSISFISKTVEWTKCE